RRRRGNWLTGSTPWCMAITMTDSTSPRCCSRSRTGSARATGSRTRFPTWRRWPPSGASTPARPKVQDEQTRGWYHMAPTDIDLPQPDYADDAERAHLAPILRTLVDDLARIHPA